MCSADLLVLLLFFRELAESGKAPVRPVVAASVK